MAIKQVENINLEPEIEDWENAYCGEDVRAANVLAFEKIQGIVNDTVQNVNEAAEQAEQAVDIANAATTRAEEVNDASAENVKLAKNWSDQSQEHAEASAGSAKTAESWAVGGTGTRDGENTNNAQYWSGEAERQAVEANNAADRAAQYSKIVAPDFYLDTETGILGMKDGVGVDFAVADGVLGWKITA